MLEPEEQSIVYDLYTEGLGRLKLKQGACIEGAVLSIRTFSSRTLILRQVNELEVEGRVSVVHILWSPPLREQSPILRVRV